MISMQTLVIGLVYIERRAKERRRYDGDDTQ
jgi:hypothetical protein